MCNRLLIIVISRAVILKVLKGSGTFKGAALILSCGQGLHFKGENDRANVDTTVPATSGPTAARRADVPRGYEDRSPSVAFDTIPTRPAFSDVLSTASSA